MSIPVPTPPLYCAVDDIRVYLPLDLPTNLDPDMIEVRIGKESRYVDDYLAGQYQIPFPGYPNTPGSISKATEMLVVYWLYVSAGMSSEKDDPRQNLWTRAHKILDQIRTREIILGSGENLQGITLESSPLITGGATGPASLTNQEYALGPVHRPMSGGQSWPMPPEERP